MKRLFVLVFVLISGFIRANKTDSLELVLKSNLADTERVNTLNALTFQTYLSDINAALPYSLKAFTLAKKIKFNKGLIYAYLYGSYLQKGMGKNEEALKFIDTALTICETNRLEYLKVKLLNQKGNIYGDLGDISKSLSFYLEASKIAEKYNDVRSLIGCYSNIGICFMSNKQYGKSKEYLHKAIYLINNNNILTKITDLKAKGNTYNSLGLVFMEENLLMDSSVYYFKLGEKIYTEINYKRGLGFCAYYLGSSYSKKGNTKDALVNFEKATKIYIESGNYAELPGIYANISEIYLKENKVDKALEYGKKSLEEGIKENSPLDIKESYLVLKEVYELKGDYKTSLNYYSKYVSLKDSLFNTESTQQMADMQTKYETDKKENENKALQEKNGIAAKTIQQQKYIGIAIGAICLLLVAFAFTIYRANKQKHKINVQLERKNIMIEKQKEIVEEKQKEILDSIHYAKRIQRALLPTDKYFERNIKALKKDA